MSDGSRKSNQAMDGFSLCVAMIRRNDNGTLVVTACNDAFFRMVGWTDAARPGFPIPFDTLMPASAPRAFRETLVRYFIGKETDGREQTHDFREGPHRWRLSLKPITLAQDRLNVTEVLVTGVDAAATREPESAPEDNTSRYQALVDLAYDAIVTMDQQHNITLFNRAAENMFGYTSAEVLGRPIVTLLPEKFRAGHPRKVQQFADTYQPRVRQATPPRMDDTNSVYGQHRDGSIIPVEIAVSKIELNGATEFMAVVRDISDRFRLMQLLKKQATTDALTGLPNRRGFLAFVEQILATDDDLSVFILDIDRFKDINDRHGHDAGDEVLRALGETGAAMTPEPYLFARWGGEEFVAALPGANADLARRIADDLRQRYERQDFKQTSGRMPTPFTVSIGVVTRARGERDVDALMKRADKALYRAKASGRNRTESA
ncbi:diguanylate cyclase [Robbsia andropogonis]|uniref:diguanylate cyclase n=2 Tax=Robbsia andropogonis TaxID=28092 RepID=A0A0F5K451_9BURK|nr:diguanylate cyclase [Robbsia andropogonis]KKB64911.1 diguanylate cyclase [Robbsia andropogonis]MCP1119173.1 diguanylate cyclase [Robbsia andropogonis]